MCKIDLKLIENVLFHNRTQFKTPVVVPISHRQRAYIDPHLSIDETQEIVRKLSEDWAWAVKIKLNGRSRHIWEMDHILPVEEGGGACGIENLRVLCKPCHSVVTGELRKRLARMPKKRYGAKQYG